MSSSQKRAPKTLGTVRAALLPWERATGVAEAALPGWVEVRHAPWLSGGGALIIMVLLGPVWGVAAVPVGLLLGRLLALDATTYTLPNIYTVPLIVVGGLHATLHGWGLGTLAWFAALGAAAVMGRLSKAEWGVGEGDLKLLAAMGAFTGGAGLCAAAAVGALLWLPAVVARPQRTLPLGVPLILGWVAVLAAPTLPERLFSPITMGL